MVTIYLMRHGETTANASHQMQGWTDSPLTDKGVENIKEIGRNLSIKFDAAYSSDSKRAITSAQLILAAKGQTDLPIKTDSRLREWSLGSLEMKSVLKVLFALVFRALKRSHFRRPTFEDFAESLHGLDTSAQTESWAQIDQRIHAVMAEISQSGAKDILVVSHGFIIAAVLGMARADARARFGMKNGQMFKIVYSDGHFELQE